MRGLLSAGGGRSNSDRPLNTYDFTGFVMRFKLNRENRRLCKHEMWGDLSHQGGSSKQHPQPTFCLPSSTAAGPGFSSQRSPTTYSILHPKHAVKIQVFNTAELTWTRILRNTPEKQITPGYSGRVMRLRRQFQLS